MGCVYLAENLANGKKYVGKSIYGLEHRRKGHAASAAKGVRTLFCHAIRKYGMASFVWRVLFESDDAEELNAKEKELIKSEGAKSPYGYNLTDGGEGLVNPSAEVREKIRQSVKRLPPISEETRRKISLSSTGRVASRETREKRRIAATGRRPSEAAKRKMRAAKIGKKTGPRPAEVGRKISQAKRGKPLSPEHIMSLRISHLGFQHTPESNAKRSAALKGKPWSKKRREAQLATKVKT